MKKNTKDKMIKTIKINRKKQPAILFIPCYGKNLLNYNLIET